MMASWAPSWLWWSFCTTKWQTEPHVWETDKVFICVIIIIYPTLKNPFNITRDAMNFTASEYQVKIFTLVQKVYYDTKKKGSLNPEYLLNLFTPS